MSPPAADNDQPLWKSEDQAARLAELIARESGNALFLITGPRSTKRIPRPQIADVRPSQISIMPQGLDAQLTREELADLIAFLASLK